MRRSLAQRQRERAAAHAAKRQGVATAPESVKEVIEEEEDAAELEYQEKRTRQRRPRKPKATNTTSSKPKRTYTRRKKDEN